LSSYMGWKKRQEPVLLTAVDVWECGMNNGSSLNGEFFMLFFQPCYVGVEITI